MSQRNRIAWLFAWFCSACTAIPAVAAEEQTVTVYRDVWGVPHVYAETEAAGAYGLGYAQAEDRLGDIYQAVRTGLGRMSEAFGKQYVEQDYIMKLCRNEELAREAWNTTSPELKAVSEGFTAGVIAYTKDHPDKVPEYSLDLEPWMIATVGRAMILRWPLGTIQDDLKNGRKREAPAMGSNQWSVAPSRSADGRAILLADPHLTWEGLAVLYEARVHAGDLNMNGFFVIGSPLMGFGHTAHVGWANTTGGPDTSDVYEIKLKIGLGMSYEYDGEQRPVKVKVIEIPIKDSKALRRPALYTHLGPLVAEPDRKTGKAYVGASPYLDSTGLFEQFYKMNKAKNAKEFYAALGMNQYNEQNVMFADTSGTIGYVRNGATPIRPEGYDWSRPVPGDSSKTAWKGIHSIDDLVHIFNPPQGYMQNCNISPANMMVNSSLTPDKYRDYVYNVSWDLNNPRGRRSVEILDADDSVTVAEAEQYAMDVYDRLAPMWKDTLKQAAAANDDLVQNQKELAAAIAAIQAWDGRLTADATATCAYKFWRLKCGEQIDCTPLAKAEPLPKDAQRKLIELLGQTVKELEEKYGRWDIAWGEVHRIGRGDLRFPVGGSDFQSGNREANFTETLLDVGSKDDPQHPGKYLAHKGSMSTILMFFGKDGIESKSCICWGQSADPASPHYMDQGEKLYGHQKMKPTFWKKADLLQNLESERVLTVQPLETLQKSDAAGE